MLKSNNLLKGCYSHLFILTFLFFLLSIYRLGENLTVIGLALTLFAYLFAGRHSFILLTCLSAPFIFLIRVSSPGNVFLASFLDICAIFSIVQYSIKKFTKSELSKYLSIKLILIYLAVISLIVPFVHVFDIIAIPFIFRQYVLPFLFVLIFFSASQKDNELPRVALLLSIFSYSLVSIIALLNYFNQMGVNPSYVEVYPYLNYLDDDDAAVVSGRSFGSNLIPRLNPFLGGALGSSSSILMSLALISFFNCFKISGYKSYGYFICALLMTSAALMTLSFSVVTPILFVMVFVFVFSKIKFLMFPVFIYSAYILLFDYNFSEMNAISYFKDSFFGNLYSALSGGSMSSFVFGSGPKFTTSGFQFNSRDYPGDIGMFRVLIEAGLVVFAPLFIFILCVCMKYCCANNRAEYLVKSEYFLIFLVMIFSVHTILFLIPPFYPLFAISVSGIYLLFRMKNV